MLGSSPGGAPRGSCPPSASASPRTTAAAAPRRSPWYERAEIDPDFPWQFTEAEARVEVWSLSCAPRRGAASHSRSDLQCRAEILDVAPAPLQSDEPMDESVTCGAQQDQIGEMRLSRSKIREWFQVVNLVRRGLHLGA